MREVTDDEPRAISESWSSTCLSCACSCWCWGVGCLIADFVFPHIRPLQKWLDSLPEYEDDAEIARMYEEERRRRRARRKARRKGMMK